MKKTMFKQFFPFLLLGAGYLSAEAQELIVYKTDGSTLEIPVAQMDSIVVRESTDDPGGGSGGEGIVWNDLIGEWDDGGLGYSNDYSLTFTATQVTVSQSGSVVYQGAYTLADGMVSFTMDGTKYRSMAGLAGGESTLIMKEVYEEEDGSESENLAFIVVKKGMKVVTDKADIQGQWLWWMDYMGEEKTVRISYAFDGDTFDIIIVAWGQRYKGTYTYEGGILELTTTEGYTSREPGTGYGVGEGNLDPVTLEGTWSTLYQENWFAPERGLFLAVKNEACAILLMPSICTKK